MSLRQARSFSDLLTMTYARSGTCRFCRSWKHTTHSYGTRANVCVECIEQRKGEVLPSVLKAEGKARHYFKRSPDVSPHFLMMISRAPLAYCEKLIADAKAAQS